MSLQTTISLLVYAIYGITDTYFLSVGIGSLAAAGASIVSPVIIALGGVATIVGSGGASVVSRALGEHDRERASRTVANTFLIFWAASVPISVIGAVFIEPIVYALGATESVAPYAIAYGRIIFLGAVTSTGYSAIVRADGSSGFSTAMWVVPVGVNLLLCWLFVMVLRLGAAGAALATVLGQTVSVAMSVYFFFFRKGSSYKIRFSHFRPDWRTVREIVAIGAPSFLKSLGNSLVVIVTNWLLKDKGGDAALGAFAIVNRLYAALGTPQTGIAQGVQPLIGYNYGQRKLARVRETMKLSLGASTAYGSLACALCLALPGPLVAALSKEAAILATGRRAMMLLALSYPLCGVSALAAVYFQSVGEARAGLFLALGGILAIRLPVLIASAGLFGLDGVWSSWAASELLLCAASVAMLRRQSAGS
jgi:putative efflux protein, MATE family